MIYIRYYINIYIIYTSFHVTQVSARANCWLEGKIFHKLELKNCKHIVSCSYTIISAKLMDKYDFYNATENNLIFL